MEEILKNIDSRQIHIPGATPVCCRVAMGKNYDQLDLDELVWAIRSTPRKCLGFKTPGETFLENLNRYTWDVNPAPFIYKKVDNAENRYGFWQS